MSKLLETMEVPLSVAVPSQLPVGELRIWKMRQGAEPFAMLVDGENRLLALCANRLTDGLDGVLARCEFCGPASASSPVAAMLGVGYVVIGHRAAEWLTREMRLVLDLRPKLKAALAADVELLTGGVA